MSKKSILKKIDKLGVDYKLIPIGDYTELVLYPDNYEEDAVYFTYCEFKGNSVTRYLTEDSRGQYHDELTEDEFLHFVKNFKL